MQPLSEFIEQHFPHEYIQVEGKPETREHKSHCPPCLLQAWLREADKHVALRIIRAVPPALTPLRLDASNKAYEHVREELLGTTRTEGGK